MTAFSDLREQFIRDGVVTWIGVRAQRKALLSSLAEVVATAGEGLRGDHYSAINGPRQVTLIQEEHLEAVASFLGRERVDPAAVRRNIVVSGINLLALKGRSFQIGSAVLVYTGECHPCSRMEVNLGEGGYNAMRGHGGITARVLKSGVIKVGDQVMKASETST